MRSAAPCRVDTFAPVAIIATFVLIAFVSAAPDRKSEVMRIEVENLTEAGKPFSHSYSPEEVELDDEQVSLKSDALVEGRASRKGDEVRLVGRISAGLEVLCDRCLAPGPVPLEIEFDTSFLPQEATAGATENVELLSEDLGLSAYEGGSVDLDELVREQILLALPTRRLCRDECKGLCPACGADLNAEHCGCERAEVDPRWSALADLKKDEGGT